MELEKAIGRAIVLAQAEPGKRFGVYSVVVDGSAAYVVRADYAAPERGRVIGHACTLPNSSLVAYEARSERGRS